MIYGLSSKVILDQVDLGEGLVELGQEVNEDPKDLVVHREPEANRVSLDLQVPKDLRVPLVHQVLPGKKVRMMPLHRHITGFDLS